MGYASYFLNKFVMKRLYNATNCGLDFTSFKGLPNVIISLQNDDVATAWLNNEAVRTAIHARPVKQICPMAFCIGASL